MNIPIKFKTTPQYLYVKLSGEWAKESMFNALDEIKREADKQEMKLILVDILDVSPPANEMIRYDTGMKIAEIFSGAYKIATYSQREKITHFAENVAVNRGASIRVFDNETEAINWLISSKSQEA